IITLPSGSRALVALGIGLAVLLAFAWHERHTPAPMTPPHLFRSPTFVGANLLTLVLYFALTGVFFVLPFLLVRVHGYSATATGAAYLPFALLVGGLSRWSGGLADRFGARLARVPPVRPPRRPPVTLVGRARRPLRTAPAAHPRAAAHGGRVPALHPARHR